MYQLNNIPIDDFFKKKSAQLEIGDTLSFNFEDKHQRYKRLYGRLPKLMMYGCQVIDFFIHRVLPRLAIFSPLYFFMTNHLRPNLTYTEIVGRLLYYGFAFPTTIRKDGITTVHTKKIGIPSQKKIHEGIFIKLERVSKNGETFLLYKIRTMHPYSSYLQSHLYQSRGMSCNGAIKIADDFRISFFGSFLRKYWLDEIPSLLNLFMGQVKIIGIRPISKAFLNELPKEHINQRIKYKPGLIPPGYCVVVEKLEDIIKIEKEYMEAYSRSPLKTDITYFFLFIKNFVFKGVRSH